MANERVSPWVLAIIIFFVLVALANVGLIIVAASGADEVVPSYATEPR